MSRNFTAVGEMSGTDRKSAGLENIVIISKIYDIFEFFDIFYVYIKHLHIHMCVCVCV